MDTYHQELLKQLKSKSGSGCILQRENKAAYIGTDKPCLGLKASVKKQIVHNFLTKYPNLTRNEYIVLLNSLSRGNFHEEISLLGRFLQLYPHLRKQVYPQSIYNWLGNCEGWSEVDSICQSKFSGEEILSSWNIWNKLLIRLNKDNNVHRRRGSLVFLTRPVRDLYDSRLKEISLCNIDKLKHEKDILITKAISWLLRDMIKNYRKHVEQYVRQNRDILPKLAVRETTNKLKTGKK